MMPQGLREWSFFNNGGWWIFARACQNLFRLPPRERSLNFFRPPRHQGSHFSRSTPIMYSNAQDFLLKRGEFFLVPLSRGVQIFFVPPPNPPPPVVKKWPLPNVHLSSWFNYSAALCWCIMPTFRECVNPVGSAWCMNAAPASYLLALHSCTTTKGHSALNHYAALKG